MANPTASACGALLSQSGWVGDFWIDVDVPESALESEQEQEQGIAGAAGRGRVPVLVRCTRPNAGNTKCKTTFLVGERRTRVLEGQQRRRVLDENGLGNQRRHRRRSVDRVPPEKLEAVELMLHRGDDVVVFGIFHPSLEGSPPEIVPEGQARRKWLPARCACCCFSPRIVMKRGVIVAERSWLFQYAGSGLVTFDREPCRDTAALRTDSRVSGAARPVRHAEIHRVDASRLHGRPSCCVSCPYAVAMLAHLLFLVVAASLLIIIGFPSLLGTETISNNFLRFWADEPSIDDTITYIACGILGALSLIFLFVWFTRPCCPCRWWVYQEEVDGLLRAQVQLSNKIKSGTAVALKGRVRPAARMLKATGTRQRCVAFVSQVRLRK